MADRERIKSLYASGLSMTEIARMFDVSRQYIHIVVKDYRHTGRSGRKSKYKRFGKCKGCGAEARHLHHKDFNNANDDKSNLEPVCIPCHAKIHAERKQRVDSRCAGNIPDEKRIEIMSYHYGYTRNGKPGLGFGVLTKFDITPKQFELIEQWYDHKYGVPEFKHVRKTEHEFPDDIEFIS